MAFFGDIDESGGEVINPEGKMPHRRYLDQDGSCMHDLAKRLRTPPNPTRELGNWSLAKEFLYQAQRELNRGRFGESEEFLQMALAIDRYEPLVYRAFAHLAYDSRRPTVYAHFRDLFIHEQSPMAMVQYFEGIVSFRRGAFQDADSCFRNSIALDPTNLYAYNNLAISNLYQGEVNRASFVFKHVLRRFKDRGDVKGVALVRGNLGLVLAKRGRKIQAKMCLQAAARQAKGPYLLPERLNALCNLSELLLTERKYAQAIQHSERALKIAAGAYAVQQQIRSLVCLGVAYHRSRQTPLALEFLQKALLDIIINKDDFWKATVLLQMASILRDIGESRRADIFIDEATELCHEKHFAMQPDAQGAINGSKVQRVKCGFGTYEEDANGANAPVPVVAGGDKEVERSLYRVLDYEPEATVSPESVNA